MLAKDRTPVATIAILFTAAALVLGLGSGLAQVASEKSPTLISLDVKQMDLQDLLRLIAEKANVNIIAGSEVTGSVTLRLKNVDLWQALESVLRTSGFAYREEDGVIRVVKAEELGEVQPPLLVTEIILLEFTEAENAKKAFEHLLSASGTIQADSTSNALIVTDVPEDIENIKKRVAELEEVTKGKVEKEEIGIETLQKDIEDMKKRMAELEEEAVEKEELLPPERFQLKHLDVEEEKDALTDVLSNMIGEDGRFSLDSLANSVYVEAPASIMERVKEYLEGADVPPKRIMIRAEFVEVRLEEITQLGIKWRWKGAYDRYPLGSTFRYPYYVRPEPGEAVPTPRAPLSTLAGGLGIIFGSVEQELRGLIDLLLSEDKASLLSSPSIVTLDGKEARIHVGDKIPYLVSSWKEGQLFESTHFLDLGTTLKVTPQIKGGNRVVLDIHPEVKEKTGDERWMGGPPVVGTRDAQTKIEVEEGKSIVIGGLLKDNVTSHREGVPVLSRLPIIGSLFTYKKTEKKKTDLLVFITPSILPEDIEQVNVIEERTPLKVQVDELFQQGLEHKESGEYEKARQIFGEVIEKSTIYGFIDYRESAEKELVNIEKLEEERLEQERLEQEERLDQEKKEKERLEKEKLEKERQEKAKPEKARKAELKKERLEKQRLEKERLEKQRLEKERQEKARLEKVRKAKLEKERARRARLGRKEGTTFALGLGGWSPSEYDSSLFIYEAQVRLKENLTLFGAGSNSTGKSSYISYFGVRTGDRFNVGVGRMSSSTLDEDGWMVTGGVSLGTERVRLEAHYLYVPAEDDGKGIRTMLGIRF